MAVSVKSATPTLIIVGSVVLCGLTGYALGQLVDNKPKPTTPVSQAAKDQEFQRVFDGLAPSPEPTATAHHPSTDQRTAAMEEAKRKGQDSYRFSTGSVPAPIRGL